MDDQPINRMKHLLAMVEKGTINEARIARVKLNNLLQKHGLTEDDLIDNKQDTYWFSVKNKNERKLLIQIYARIIRNSQPTYWSRKGASRRIGLDLTAAQYIMFCDYVEAYQRQFRKELKEIQDSLMAAFVAKHRLYFQAAKDDTDECMSPEKLNEILAIMKNLSIIEPPNPKIAAGG